MKYATQRQKDMKDITHVHRFCTIVLLLLFYLAEHGDAGRGIPGIELLMPPSHVALSGDLHVQIASSSFPPLLMQLSRLEGNLAQPLSTFPVFPEASALALNSTLVKIPCGYFSRGGQYYVLVKKQPVGPKNATSLSTTDINLGQESSIIIRSLDVRWPMPQLTLTPEHLQTYPEQPVSAILEFPEVVCPPVVDSPATAIPEFWMELHYCGHSLLSCGDSNRSSSQILYSEQVRSFPSRRILTLSCEYFGIAGHYALFLRPTTPIPSLPHTAAYVKADWSEKFVFNVHARSIFPCDVHNGGITVLFQYPSCILAGDRVRLFANERANVASLAPPTSKKYIAEQRVERGKHSLQFDCELFTERYVEYCFVYVSQAISGAVSEVREDCVPTLPVSEQESGGWGLWSAWTACSSTCIGGTKSRYRFCDSPPPRYGAKFCQGHAVETEKCGTSWECFYSSSGVGGVKDVGAVEMPEVQAEVGPFCRCGCVVHLGRAKPKRLLATSSQSCPGRTFWLIQADEDYIVHFRVEQFHLPCGTQWLKIRDGNSLAATLLADLWGGRDATPSVVNSTGPTLLLEFFSQADVGTLGMACGGGFLAQAVQMKSPKISMSAIPVAQSIGVVPAVVLKLTAVHIAAIFFLSGLVIATALLAAQYLFRYRKYHVARGEDQDSLADPNGSNASLPLTTRASSNATLISEVISLTRLRPPQMKGSKNRHRRLRESMDCEGAHVEEESGEVTLAKGEESLSGGSTTTLTHQEVLNADILQHTTPTTEVSSSCSQPSTPNNNARTARGSTKAASTSEKYLSDDKDVMEESAAPKRIVRRLSNVSNATLTNGCYSSPASMVSRATIRSTTSTAKETKEKKNREKLLAGPNGSDFSIAAQDMDLEMDYYDYNVVNAGAAPGSYLGMDPAFLVWIPPLDESGEILPEECHEMEDIRPKTYVDPGSKPESPEEEMLLPKVRHRSVSESTTPKCSPILNARNKRVHPQLGNKYTSEIRPLVDNNNRNNRMVTIQVIEKPKKLKSSPKISSIEMEKGTEVVKSPSLDGGFYDNLKFADEEEEDLDNQCNIDVSYQDSNILSSS